MPFREKEWKCRYVAGRDNPLNEFLVPALKLSKRYYRVAGYFSSNVLSAAAAGLARFIENGDQMHMIVGAELTKEDVEAIQKGTSTPKQIIEQQLVLALENIENEIIRNRLGVLAWLVSEGKLRIKIGYPKRMGKIVHPRAALFHEKIAIFEDEYGDMMQIEGSENETAAAWALNRESFSLHRSWVEGEEKYVADALEEFNALWHNADDFSEVIDLPDAVERKLLVFKPKKRPKTDPLESEETQPPLAPRKCQLGAIDAWKKNFAGIISMATGSGKTLAALWAIQRHAPADAVIVLCAPTIVILDQWFNDEIPRVFDKRMLRCYSDAKWKKRLHNFIELSLESGRGGVLLCTLDSFSSDFFINTINRLLPKEKFVLIADEVHSLGAAQKISALKKIDPKYRLGLSATPKRHYDEEGTEAIMDFFGGVVFWYSLEDALRDKILTPYQYFLHQAPLTPEELARYKRLTQKIKQVYAKLKNSAILEEDLNKSEELTALVTKRAMIRKSAASKMNKLTQIIENSGEGKEYPPLNRCLIYCSTIADVEKVSGLLFSERSIPAFRYTSKQLPSVREIHLKKFREENNSVLVAVGCLDQGVDVPSCDSAIILASTKEPRQFIQRRGRVLRKAKGKEKAVIHDFICLPYSIERMEMDLPNMDPDEYKILNDEVGRIYEFAEYALNSKDVLKYLNLVKEIMARCYLGKEVYTNDRR